MTASRRALIIVGVLVAVMRGLPWGGAVPEASAQSIQVTSATPDTADQGTVSLPVTVKGNGFKKGAKAKFYKTGTTDAAGITVTSTRFVSSSELTATIDISSTAAVAGFDIEVQNADGRTGKGTELFSVTAKRIDPCTLPDPVPTPAGHISDVPGYHGYLDSTFGNGTGRVIGPQHVKFAEMDGGPVAIDGAGRIVAVGTWHNTCVTNAPFLLAVARYLPDGSLDTAFGSDGTGVVTMGFAGSAHANAVVVQPDNKVVVVGGAKQTKSSNILPVVVRFNENGKPDASFGSGGTVWVSPGGKFPGGQFEAVTLDSNGRIVAAGSDNAYSPAPFISRLNANGSLDATFNGSGKYLWTSPGHFRALTTQVVAGEERVVAAGVARDSNHGGIAALWRFTSAGVLDVDFNGSGVVTTRTLELEDGHYFSEPFNSVTVDPSSNRIVAAGYSSWDDPPGSTYWLSRVLLARYNEDGALDTSFGMEGTGTVSVPFLQEKDYGRAVAIQPDGRILVAGYSYAYDGDTSVNDLAVLWRFTADGEPDWAFGPWGLVTDPITSGMRMAVMGGVALQPDGKIVVAGYLIMESDPLRTFGVLARFWQ